MQSQIESESNLLSRFQIDCAKKSPRHPLLILGLVSTLGVVAVDAIAASAQAASLTSWNFDPSANQLEITVKDGTTPRYFLMAQPARIVVDLPDTSIGSVDAQQTYSGAVRQIRVSQFQPGMARIVMELSPNVALAPKQVQLQKVDAAQPAGSRWTVRPLIASSASATKTPASVKPSTPSVITPSLEPSPPVSSSNASNKTPLTRQVNSGDRPIQPNSSVASVDPAMPVTPKTDTSATSAAMATVTVPPLKPVSAAKPSAAPDPKPAVSPTSGGPTTEASVSRQPPLSSSVAPNPLPDSDLALDTTGAVAIAVPSPVVPLERSRLAPTIGTAGVAAQVPAVSVPSIASERPVEQSAASAPVRSDSNSSTSAVDIPTTAIVPSSTSSVSVPPLNRQASTPVSSSATSTLPDRGANGLGEVTVSLPAAPPLERQAALRGSTLPATPAVSQPTQVSVPALAALPAASANQTAIADVGSTPLPPTVTVPSLQPVATPAAVSVPPLQPATPAPVQASPLTTPPRTGITQGSIVEFGQPLPSMPVAPQGSVPQPQVDRSNSLPQSLQLSPGVLLPAGTILNLQYPGGQVLSLRTNSPHQEVLLLQSEIRNAVGTIIAPEGSMITGRFETNSVGSRFVTQSIALQGRTIPIVAQSDTLAGNRKIVDNRLVLNSGIGAVAGSVLGGISGSTGLGVVGGAATGAAVTYLTAPKPATIQPGQVVQVRLLEDLR